MKAQIILYTKVNMLNALYPDTWSDTFLMF